MTKRGVVAASLLLTLAACGGADTPTKGSSQSDVWQVMCEQRGDAFGAFVAQQLDSGDSRATVQSHVQDTCPDRSDDLTAVFAGLDSVTNACSIPKGNRDDSQERLAEAMGC